MNLKNKVVYYCQYCQKHYLVARYCLQHQQVCSKNPLNQHACYSCNNLQLIDTVGYIDTPWGEIKKKYKSFFCKKCDKFVFPRRAQIKKYTFMQQISTDKQFEQMPNKCQNYQQKVYC